MRIAAVSDLFAARPSRTSARAAFAAAEVPLSLPVFVPQHGVPTLAQLSEFDAIVVLGTIIDADRAVELGGVLDHLLDRRKTIALLYYVRLDEPGIAAIASRLLPTVTATHGPSGHHVMSTEAAWEGFFRSYGRSATSFANFDGRVLAVVAADPSPLPVALELSVRTGTIYVLPFHVGDRESHASLERVVFDLRDAITSDRAQMLPVEYLADLRLPGEQDVLDKIADLQNDLAAQNTEAARLYRYRLLLGRLHGDPLEELVRDALSVILESTDFRVEDRPERFGEDFWITGPGGDVALAEVKGISSGVGRREINQVDNHREERGYDTTDLPGLLVVNVHRQDTDLSRKTSEHVHPNTIAALRRQNVTLLRSADLYALLGRSLRGDAAGQILIDSLTSGGGWLEVTDEEVTLHGGERGTAE
jgi:hypothetical protein